MTHPRMIYRIRFAEAGDLGAVVKLRADAESWLQAAGIEQWTVHATGEENIRESIARGSTYVVTNGAGDVVGSFALDDVDLDFWTPTEAAQPALYLYKFMLDHPRRGGGLGDALLDWCCGRAEQVGARWLRLDCWKTNEGLHKYYEARGFARVGTRTAEGRKSGALFERSVVTRLADLSSIRLVDEAVPSIQADHLRLPSYDRYDPTGEAAIWMHAAAAVEGMRNKPHPGQTDQIDVWDHALDAAARHLEQRATQVRHAGGL